MRQELTTLVMLTLGSAGTAAAQQLHWSQGGNFSTATFGDTVDIAGDVNGDGIDDVIIGDLDASPVLFHEGQALVLSGVDGSVLLTLNGQTTLEGVGYDVAGVGDIDGDGRADVVVAAAASAPVLYSGATGLPLHTFTAQGSSGARVVAAAGDVNADGIDDIVLGDASHGSFAGRAWVVSGAFIRSGQLPELLHVFDGVSAGARLGSALDGAGDVDGDGWGDLIVSATSESGQLGQLTYNGVVRVYSGATGSAIRVSYYTLPPSGFGDSVAGVGDMDGDGFGEVAIGAPYHDKIGGTNQGAVWLFAGVDGTAKAFIEGAASNERLGWSVDGAGDVNGDQFGDLLVGVIGANGAGAARLYSGDDGTSFATISAAGGAFGWAVAGAADLDGDTFADLVVTAPALGASGRVYAYRGECQGLNASYCVSLANSFSAGGASITASGSTSLADKNLTLIARECPPGNIGLFFFGDGTALVPFGDGRLCISGTLFRFLPAAVIDTAGIATHGIDFNSAPAGAGAGMIQAGDTRYFQFWFRDPGGPGGTGFNTSDGRQVTFCP